MKERKKQIQTICQFNYEKCSQVKTGSQEMKQLMDDSYKWYNSAYSIDNNGKEAKGV